MKRREIKRGFVDEDAEQSSIKEIVFSYLVSVEFLLEFLWSFASRKNWLKIELSWFKLFSLWWNGSYQEEESLS